MEPAISAIATLTCSGTANPSPAGVSILSFWYFLVTAVPCFEAVSWRTPHTYLTGGAGGGPPPQLLRDPGQPHVQPLRTQERLSPGRRDGGRQLGGPDCHPFRTVLDTSGSCPQVRTPGAVLQQNSRDAGQPWERTGLP